jgi:hypothetical protein
MSSALLIIVVRLQVKHLDDFDLMNVSGIPQEQDQRDEIKKHRLRPDDVKVEPSEHDGAACRASS